MDYQYYDFEDDSKKHSGLIVVGKKEESWEVFLNMPAAWFKSEFSTVTKLAESLPGSKMLSLFIGTL